MGARVWLPPFGKEPWYFSLYCMLAELDDLVGMQFKLL